MLPFIATGLAYVVPVAHVSLVSRHLSETADLVGTSLLTQPAIGEQSAIMDAAINPLINGANGASSIVAACLVGATCAAMLFSLISVGFESALSQGSLPISAGSTGTNPAEVPEEGCILADLPHLTSARRLS